MALLALIGFVPLTLALFATLPARRAAIATVLGGWLFLPMAGLNFPGLPDFDKSSAVASSLFLGMVAFDSARLARFRLRLVDLPMLGWIFMPGVSVMVNDIGEGALPSLVIAAKLVLHYVINYGVFWLAGRVYFTKLEDIRELAVGFVIAGLVYVPLCALEMLISPQLHHMVYGFHQHAFGQTIRLGGYRPMVFMQHGLMLGLFMANAALVALWLWRAQTVRVLHALPMSAAVGVLMVTAVLCRSAGAMALLMLALGFVFASKWLNTKVVMAGMLAIAPVYIGLRATAYWTGDNVVAIAMSIDEDRGKSLRERLRNENLYVEKAQESPIVGHAGWNRWQMRDEDGEILTVPDGFWVIALGRFGAIGLASMMLIWLQPMIGLLRSHGSPRDWWRPDVAPAAAMATVLTIFMIDSLLNAMVSDYYTLTAGALAGVLPLRRAAARRVVHEAPLPPRSAAAATNA